ncbi:WD domain-containing protein, G-beta repeat-containing protein [Streptomyces sp. SolWspMP-5a-2]|nr:WD domain-containing protein, G-beta repeat-containing protein [Streptomyces sp. SolWspMP-5a-2]
MPRKPLRFLEELALHQSPVSGRFSPDATFLDFLALTPSKRRQSRARRKRPYRPGRGMSSSSLTLFLSLVLVGGAAFGAGWLLHLPLMSSPARSPWSPITSQADIKRTYTVGSSPVTGLAFSPDGRLLVATTYSGRVVVRDTFTGREVNKKYTPESTGAATGVTFNPDGRTYAVSTSTGAVLLMAAKDGNKVAFLPSPNRRGSAVTSTAYSHDGRTLAVANAQGTVQLWSVDRERPAILATPGRQHSVSDVAFDRRNATLAVASVDGTVQLWDVQDPSRPEVLSTVQRGLPATSIGYSPDGSVLAAGSSDGTTKFWNVRNPAEPQPYREAASRSLPSGVGSISGLVFTARSRVAATTTGGYVQLWDVHKNPKLLRAPTRSQAFTSLSYNAERSTLAIGITNGTVQVWSADSTDRLGGK